MTDDRINLRTHLPGNQPIIVIDPDKAMPWFISNDGLSIGVESLALNPSYSFAKNVLVPEKTLALWLGFPSLLFLYKLVPDDVRMAPKRVLAPKGSPDPYETCWDFEYCMHLLTTIQVEESVRKKAIREAWNYFTLAALQVVRNTFRSAHTKAQEELHKARLKIEELNTLGTARVDMSRLPAFNRETFPEASVTGFLEEEDVRVSYDEKGYVYARFPRETFHRDVPAGKFHHVAKVHKENYARFGSLVPAGMKYPISYVDGSAEKDTIVVGFTLLSQDLFEIREEQDRHPTVDAWLALTKRLVRQYIVHNQHMKIAR